MAFSEQELEEFKTEASELLEVAEKSLLLLDAGTADFRSVFDSIFRSFHNLKGASGMMELTALQGHTHKLEDILMRFKDQDSMPKPCVSLFLRGVDAARTLLGGGTIQFDYSVGPETAPETAAAPVPPPVPAVPTAPAEAMAVDETALGEFITEAEEIVERVALNLRKVEAGEATKEMLDELYRDIHSHKGGAFLFGFAQTGELAHAMESSLEAVRDGTHRPSKALINALFKSVEALELDMLCTKEKLQNEAAASLVPTLVKALAAAAAELEPITGAAPTAPAEEAPAPAATTAAPEEVSPVAPAASPAAPSPSAVQARAILAEVEASASIRVPVALLDNLMTLMGEMVLVRNQVLQFSNTTEDLGFHNLSQRLNVVTNEIQGEMMKTRMQPIGNVLNKFHRVVRDLSQELGKSITLNLIGAETELDKSLLEAIKDPLTHIVRNSCDHGVEAPATRKTAGKPAGGSITVRSYHEGGQVVVEISDDGKGLHRGALVKKAVEKGLITEAQGAQMSEKEAFNLIFAPGFSTAAAITNVSGRGVGMDVVRTNIEKIGGTVDLSSKAGRGTTIKLKIPLTLAIVPALIVNAGGGVYAIPQVKLVELVRVDQSSENQIEFLQGTPVYRLRGNILPLVSLNRTLNPGAGEGSESGTANIAVLNADNHLFGLIVDGIQDTADIVVKPINRLLKSLQAYSGATILGDGSVALILDVPGLARVAKVRFDGEQGDTLRNDTFGAKEAAEASENQDFLLVRLNSPTKHAFVLGYVHRLEEFSARDVELSGEQRVVRYRGAILPLISMSKQLGYGAAATERTGPIPVVVVERGGRYFGLEVEEILDTLSTTNEPEPVFQKHTGIVGNMSENNELIVLVDPFEIISAAFPAFAQEVSERLLHEAQTPDAAPALGLVREKAAPAEPENPLRILVVEDTVFFRRAVKRILEKGGHEVTTAADGQEAWDLLQKDETAFDFIVSDIEMPRMNGFKLAANIRAHAGLKHLPLVAVSSRSDATYQKEGKKAGFDLYMEKLKPPMLLAAVLELAKKKEAA